MKEFFPAKFREVEFNRENKGKIIGLVVLSGIASPCQEGDKGWYHNVTPKGAPATSRIGLVDVTLRGRVSERRPVSFLGRRKRRPWLNPSGGN